MLKVEDSNFCFDLLKQYLLIQFFSIACSTVASKVVRYEFHCFEHVHNYFKKKVGIFGFS